MEYFNIEIEEKFLRCIIHNHECFVKLMRKGQVPNKLLSDKSHRLLLGIFQKNFTKFGKLPSKDVVNLIINKLKEKTKDDKTFKEKAEVVVDRLFDNEPGNTVVSHFDAYANELHSLFVARELQQYTMRMFDYLDGADVESAKKEFDTFRLNVVDENVDQGEYVESFREREGIVIEKYKNPEKYALLPMGIPDWDNAMGGGLGPEFMLVGGSSNTGKSFCLEHISVSNYKRGKNVLHFTIEQQKIETLNRMDCAISGLEHTFFRNPSKNWTKEKHQKWRKAINRAHRRYGKLEVISFAKGANMATIEAKVYEMMHKWGKKIHAVVIDYLDDITPMGDYKQAKDWTALGEIAWDSHVLAKSFRNNDGTFGVPTITAIQMKKSAKEVTLDKEKANRFLDERDIGTSPLPYRIADVVWGIKTIIVDKHSMLEGMKGRFFGKNKQIPVFHDFAHGKFHNEDLKDSFEMGVSDEDSAEVEALEEGSIEIDANAE